MFHNKDKKQERCKTENINQAISDFACIKMSAMKKVMRIATLSTQSQNKCTIGPQSALDKDEYNNLENIENEQNSCNIKTPQETSNNSKDNSNNIPMYTSNGIQFSMKKVIVESELQRQDELRRKIWHHIRKMEMNAYAVNVQMNSLLLKRVREREEQCANNLASILAEQEHIAEQEEIKRLHEKQLQAQKIQEEIEKNKQELEEYRKQMKEKEEMMKAAIAYQTQFMSKYCDIATLSNTYKDKLVLNAVLMANTSILKELIQQFQVLDEKIKSEELMATDVNVMESLVHHMNDILNVFRIETEKIDSQYEAELAHKTQPTNEVVATENVPTANTALPQSGCNVVINIENIKNQDQNPGMTMKQEAIVASSTTDVPVLLKSEEITQNPNCKTGNSGYIDEELLQVYLNSQQFLATYKESYKDFLDSTTTKKFRFECQKAINIPVNAISGISEEHLRDKYDRLQNLLNGKSANVTEQSQEVFFCKDHLAKKIISQGETLVSSKPEMAFPIAAVVVALWNEHVDFGELFLAHLYKACPFTMPIFLQQQEGQSSEDYYKSLGYKYLEDGTIESQDKFLKRISGLIRLYASITITRQRKGVVKTHPHGLQHAWRWLTAILNIEPRIDTCDLCATLILDILQITGNVLWTAYPKQFQKVLILLKQQYFPSIQNLANGGGPLVRLDDFLNNSLTNGIIPPPNGLLPSNFW